MLGGVERHWFSVFSFFFCGSNRLAPRLKDISEFPIELLSAGLMGVLIFGILAILSSSAAGTSRRFLALSL
jgi:hypothetical protein